MVGRGFRFRARSRKGSRERSRRVGRGVGFSEQVTRGSESMEDVGERVIA